MEILERFENIIKETKHLPVILEIGINNGYHTNIMNNIIKKYHKDYKYFAFEPDKRLRGAINGILAIHPKIVFSDSAVGQTENDLTFYLSGGEEKRPGCYKQAFTGSSSIRKLKGVFECWPDMTFEPTICHCITLDKFFKLNDIKYVDFIWMDVQGAEVDVFTGAKESLSKIKYIFTECGTGTLYEGEIGFSGICQMLSGFEIVENYGDVLFKNKNL
jgi:FkbM family methyltransferase